MFRSFAALLLLTFGSTVTMHADIAIADPADSGTWYAPVAATNASGAFWDNLSGDGNGFCNVGFFPPGDDILE